MKEQLKAFIAVPKSGNAKNGLENWVISQAPPLSQKEQAAVSELQ